MTHAHGRRPVGGWSTADTRGRGMTHVYGGPTAPQASTCRPGLCAQPAVTDGRCEKHAAERRRLAALARIMATAMTDDAIADATGLDAAGGRPPTPLPTQTVGSPMTWPTHDHDIAHATIALVDRFMRLTFGVTPRDEIPDWLDPDNPFGTMSAVLDRLDTDERREAMDILIQLADLTNCKGSA